MNSSQDAPTTADILEELRNFVADTEKLLGQSTAQPTAEAIASLRKNIEAVRERVAAFYSSARRKVADGAHLADETIRANPYQSLGVALGVGVLLGVLVGRQCR